MQRLRVEKASLKCRVNSSIESALFTRTVVGREHGPSQVRMDTSKIIRRRHFERIVVIHSSVASYKTRPRTNTRLRTDT